METLPSTGTDESLRATFRLILTDSSSSELSNIEEFIGKTVMLEPFDLPGTLLVEQGKDLSLAVVGTDGGNGSSSFRIVRRLDGNKGSVSLESVNNGNCFVFSDVNYKSGTSLKLSCTTEAELSEGASFVTSEGRSRYHPISFVANSAKRNYLLSPLFYFRDESYTVYFNSQAEPRLDRI